jgi:manganese/zinc/iron transport system substrate-binding protein
MPIARRTGLAIAIALGFAAGMPLAALADEPLTIVTTTSQIADMARNVAGERASVTALMGEGVDPHLYRQTRSDVARLRNADLVLFNGLYLEASLEDFLLELGRQQPVIALAERLPSDRLLVNADYPDKHDPHVWMDVALWATLVDELALVLSEIDPEGAELFAANASAYRSELEALDSYVGESIASIPPEARVLITAHDAFHYFGRAYDVEVMGIQGLSTESEAGLARIGELVDLLARREIGAVFVESSVADRNIRALIEGAAARGHSVTIGGELFSDAMGEPDTYEGTYLGMLDHNATVITRALGGNAPEAGLNGSLGAGS